MTHPDAAEASVADAWATLAVLQRPQSARRGCSHPDGMAAAPARAMRGRDAEGAAELHSVCLSERGREAPIYLPPWKAVARKGAAEAVAGATRCCSENPVAEAWHGRYLPDCHPWRSGAYHACAHRIAVSSRLHASFRDFAPLTSDFVLSAAGREARRRTSFGVCKAWPSNRPYNQTIAERGLREREQRAGRGLRAIYPPLWPPSRLPSSFAAPAPWILP